MIKGTRMIVVFIRTGILSILLVGCAWSLHRQLSDSLRGSIDNALRCQGEYAAYLLGNKNDISRLGDLGDHIVAHRDLPHARKLIRILGGRGEKLFEWGPAEFRKANGWVSAFLASQTRDCCFETLPVQTGSLRLASLPIWSDERMRCIVQVAVSTTGIQGDLARFDILLFFVGIAILTMVTIGGFFLTGFALEPLRKMADATRKIEMGIKLDRLVVPQTGDEMEDIGRNFNNLLDRLEVAADQMRQFAANASHQLRTPLTVMKGEIEVALRKARSPKDQERVFRSVLEEIDHSWKIVNDLLTLSLADSGVSVLEKETLDLDEVLGAVSGQYRILAQTAGCTLEVFSKPGAIVYGDREKLNQLVGNLVDNAIKYTPGGGVIKVVLARENGFRIAIRDTGVGIPANDLPRIFERFFRSKGSRSLKIRGSGLGLSICQWIAVVHGGKIEVKSRIGKGSEFTICLPEDPGITLPPSKDW